ncbi:MAG: APC family permease [Candidatus Pacebacteria bacterium]|nr:APC family permease [Candidatus Paceibacterota bacterium]
MSQLKKNLTIWSGTILFLNIVIGAGLLVLPGLAYQQVGEVAIISWMVCAIVSMPLLLVFIILGENFPDSGGIAHYAKRAFGPWLQKTSAFLFLGAVIFGLPSVALTSAYYLDSILPFEVHSYAAILLLAAASAHFFAGDYLNRLLAIIGSSVIIVLLVLLVIGYMGLELPITHMPTAPSFNFMEDNLLVILSPFMMIFFAFTGWEVGSHAAEEFKKPRRDFRLAMGLSFIIATILYFAIALLVHLSAIDKGFESPFIEVTRPILGENGKYAVAIAATLLIFANLFGAIWGVSRLTYSLGRDGILPKSLGVTRNGNPLVAVAVVLVFVLLATGLDYSGMINLKTMLSLAGQNFLILYAIAAFALYRLSQRLVHKLLSVLVIGIALTVLYFTGTVILYPILIIAVATIFHLNQKRRGKKAAGRNEG